MFTGIVEQTAVVKGIAKRHDVYELLLQFSKSIEGLKIGDSVAVSGVCLTAVKIDGNNASFDIMNETFKKTSFGNVKVGDIVMYNRWGGTEIKSDDEELLIMHQSDIIAKKI